MSHSGWSTSNYLSGSGNALLPTTTPYTIAIRCKLSSGASGAGFGLVTDTSNWVYVGVINVGVRRTTIQIKATTQDGIVGGTNLSTGVWYSIVGVCRSATDREVYLDGVSNGTSTTSKAPTSFTSVRAGLDGSGATAWPGSLAEVAIWNVALSATEIGQLNFKSPKSVRPDSLASYLKLLDNGNRDEMALPATVTGTLTKDTDHPRVYYQRRSSGIWAPNFTTGGGTISGEATQTLAPYTKTQTGTLTLKGSASQTLAPYSKTQTGAAIITGQQ